MKNATVEISLKAHTDRTRFGNATQIFSFQKQIKPSTGKNFTRYADQIAKIALGGSLQLLVEFEVDLVRRHFRVVRVENSWCFLHKRQAGEIIFECSS
jgi:hypothetical protein